MVTTPNATSNSNYFKEPNVLGDAYELRMGKSLSDRSHLQLFTQFLNEIVFDALSFRYIETTLEIYVGYALECGDG